MVAIGYRIPVAASIRERAPLSALRWGSVTERSLTRPEIEGGPLSRYEGSGKELFNVVYKWRGVLPRWRSYARLRARRLAPQRRRLEQLIQHHLMRLVIHGWKDITTYEKRLRQCVQCALEKRKQRRCLWVLQVLLENVQRIQADRCRLVPMLMRVSPRYSSLDVIHTTSIGEKHCKIDGSNQHESTVSIADALASGGRIHPMSKQPRGSLLVTEFWSAVDLGVACMVSKTFRNYVLSR